MKETEKNKEEEKEENDRREKRLSTTKMSRAVMPGMTNQRGILFGGQLMAWMDEISGIAAKRFAECEVATVAVEQIKFLAPIPCGTFLDVCGEVVSVGNTSLKVVVEAWMDVQGNQVQKAAEGTFVYVALDEHGNPRKVEKRL